MTNSRELTEIHVRTVVFELGFELVHKEIPVTMPRNIGLISEFFSLDSLAFMELISAIEEKFGVTFREDSTYDELNNFNNLIAQIISLRKSSKT